MTGAGSGIGQAIAVRLAAEGARVLLADLNGDAASASAATVVDSGGEAEAIGLDVSEPAAVRRMAGVASRRGRIDILVNSAGIVRSTPRLTSPPMSGGGCWA